MKFLHICYFHIPSLLAKLMFLIKLDGLSCYRWFRHIEGHIRSLFFFSEMAVLLLLWVTPHAVLVIRVWCLDI